MVKVLHTWTCPTHGQLHRFTKDSDSSTEEGATAIVVKTTDSMYARGCTIDVRNPKNHPVPCGEHVTHLAEPLP